MRKRSSLLTWLGLLLISSILAACGSSSGSGSDPGTPATGPAAQGVAVDPYIVGAVFQEVAADGTVLQRQSTPSEADGGFRFPGPATEGSLIMTKPSATGMHNGVPYTGILKRRVTGEATIWVVSPLTTMIAADLTEQQALDLFSGAELTGLTAADLTADPMSGLAGGANITAGTRLAPLQANLAANAFMQAVGSYDVTGAFMNEADHATLWQELVPAIVELVSPATYEALAGDPTVATAGSPLTADDFVRTAANLCQAISDNVRQEMGATGGVPSSSEMQTIVDSAMTTAPAVAHQYYLNRVGQAPTPAPAPDGATLYAAECAGCHGDLANTTKAGRTADQIQAAIDGNVGNMGYISLTAVEIQAIADVLPPAPAPAPEPGQAPAPDGAALYAAECAGCHGDLANTTKVGRTADQIQAAIDSNVGNMGYISLTAEEIQAIADVLPAGNPGPDYSDCTSCHGQPPDGSTYPNGAGAHAEHRALSGVGTDCDVCHGGAAHNGWIDLGIKATFNAKSGAASENPDGTATCVNVSCHGGQTTPDWTTGSIDVNSACTGCHAPGTSQYNGYYSGQHGRSAHSGKACTVCHNTSTLATSHFSRLDTPTMEGPASATVGGGSTRVYSYNASTRTCTNSCHGSEHW